MVCSSRCFSITTTTIFGSLNNKDNNTSNKSSSLVPPSLPYQRYKNKSSPLKKKTQQPPSVAEVEKAIGAGLYRDRDPRASEEKPTMFDKILTNPFGQDETPVEKKLRETGEWIIDRTEGTTRSAGREILVVLCLWILPVWVCFLLVASGLIQLPFDLPFLDDLIM